jgi:hypothetical protein
VPSSAPPMSTPFHLTFVLSSLSDGAPALFLLRRDFAVTKLIRRNFPIPPSPVVHVRRLTHYKLRARDILCTLQDTIGYLLFLISSRIRDRFALAAVFRTCNNMLNYGWMRVTWGWMHVTWKNVSRRSAWRPLHRLAVSGHLTGARPSV